MEVEKIISLIQAVSDSKLTSFMYEKDGVKLKFGCDTVQNIVTTVPAAEVYPAVTPVAVPAAGQPAAEVSAEAAPAAAGNIVKSPLVGTFYTTPSEDAEPFVAVGDTVKKGQTLAIVEAMKLMNEIESDFDGKIEEVYVKSGEPVEYGQPLFRIV